MVASTCLSSKSLTAVYLLKVKFKGQCQGQMFGTERAILGAWFSQVEQRAITYICVCNLASLVDNLMGCGRSAFHLAIKLLCFQFYYRYNV